MGRCPPRRMRDFAFCDRFRLGIPGGGLGTKAAMWSVMSKRAEFQADKGDYLAQWNARLASVPQKASTVTTPSFHEKLDALKTAAALEDAQAERSPPSEAKPTKVGP